ncbi:MAG: xanthine dehydrogenase family protein subunit M [Acidobacteria bacterium]|nr:xanthine dehydrogenase family protein subunit M [Acidobacteriota bacterium]
MAVIRDKMPAFQLFQPASTGEALGVLDQYGADAWVLAGGLDSWDWFKDRVKKPAAVVDLGGIESLRSIRSFGGTVEIGAMATLREVVRNPDVVSQFSLLVEASELAASPQIRNQGTIGGNIGQDTRCWYYRDGWSCYRAGGNICYADTPTAMNREHAILGASRCVAVNPSDTAPALVALDAEMVVENSGGQRVIPAQDFFIGPAIDIMRMTVLQPGDILTSIRIPSTWAGQRFYFEKSRDRAVWDFPLANVASAARITNGVIEDIRIVANGVAPYPVRFTAAEDAVRGEAVSDETAERAGEIAIRGVRPLAHNGYKVALLRNLVKRSVRGAEA